MLYSQVPAAIAIVGPTAIGKTAVALEIVRLLDRHAEIFSADSVQVYRGLDIGSAKPTKQEQEQAEFRLIDIADPDQEFTLSDYQQAAIVAEQAVREKGKLPIVAGGTGLYVRALTQPLGLPQVAPNAELREKWRQFADENGQVALHAKLVDLDPEAAARLHVNDTKRIIRALEVLEQTGRRLSEWHREDRETGTALLPDVQLFGLNRARAKLNQAIEERVEKMMRNGFLDEVKRLRMEGYERTLNAMQSLGYKELNAHINGEVTLTDAVEEIQLRTRQFARRQLIWFRADKRIQWIDVEDKTPAQAAAEILTKYRDGSSRAQ